MAGGASHENREAASVEDGALVRRAQRGDEAAFELLVRRHLRAVHGIAMGIVKDGDEADDVVQDAFIAAVRKIRECRDPEKFGAWLGAIVRNRALTQRSRAGRLERDHDIAAAEAKDSPVRGAARAELREHLSRGLETLTDLQRSVLVAHDYEGRRHGEIAEMLGISAASSRFHLHVARRAMRARLGPLYAEGGTA